MAFDKKKYIHNYVKENYKRVALEYPKCWDEPVKERAKSIGKSKNEYIKYLINEDMSKNYKDWNIIKNPKKPNNEIGQNPDNK